MSDARAQARAPTETVSLADEPATPWAPRRPGSLARRVLPLALALGLLAFVLARIDFAAFTAALARVDHVGFVLFTTLWLAALLVWDGFGSYVAYRSIARGVGLWDLVLYRSASYLPGLLNYHVSQGFLTYVLSRLGGVPIPRMAGATLLSYAGWFGCLLGCVAMALPFAGQPYGYSVGIVLAGLAYLALIAARPRLFARSSLLAPLFEAGLSGHAVALAARFPHFAWLVLGHWVALAFFGVRVPALDALVELPILLVVSTLPITPQGFGTRDAVAGAFFAKLAPGATQEERLAQVAACTTSWGVLLTLLSFVLGLVAMRFVNQRLELRAEGRWRVGEDSSPGSSPRQGD